jgi:hypothetical protein
MVGKELEVVVVAKAEADDKLVPDVWQTATAEPLIEKVVELK